jgi:cyclophilin family peptidyl-prolyl cis-trans isomerase
MNRRRILRVALAAFFGGLFSCSGRAATASGEPLPAGLYAEIATPRGAITCELFAEKTPVASFVGLAEGTLGPAPRKPFFDGLAFHRVVPDFVIQGGDPLGTGEGGPGYTFPDEFAPGLRPDAAGVLAMANEGPDTNGSQFFLTLKPAPRLSYLHSVFGRVVRGLDVLPRIKAGDAMRVKIIRIGAAAKNYRADDATFAAFLAHAKKYSGAMEPGPDAPFDDADRLLPTEPSRARAFNFKLANFTRATGGRVVARLIAHAPPDTEGRKLNAHLRELAEKLGVGQRGALVLYIADRDEWKLWVGDDSAAAFMGRAGTVKDFMAGGAFHEAKQALLADARARGDAEFKRQQEMAPSVQPPPGQRLKLQLDAVLDALLVKLERP